MIFHDVTQGSPEWKRMRLGLATASCFHKIITPQKGELSKSAEHYASALVGEMITGENTENFQSYWMERGGAMEAAASSSYEIITGLTLDRGGFITNDDMTIGASPDRRVRGDNGLIIGGVEIKCPSPETHIENLKRAIKHGAIDPSYIPQVQGQILFGEFEFVDWFSYHPEMPPAHIRTYRDDVYCQKLEKALDDFIGIVNETIYLFKTIGFDVPARPIVMMREQELRKDNSEIPEYLMAG